MLIDTSPDLRAPAARRRASGVLDGVVYTHPHADHVHGIDDLRMVVYNRRARLPVWADAETTDALLSRFGYVFVPAGRQRLPADPRPAHRSTARSTVEGAGGPIPLRARSGSQHGAHRRARLPHRRPRLPPRRLRPSPTPPGPRSTGLDTFVLDALRRKPHPTHAHLDAQPRVDRPRSRPRRAVLTNMHNDLDYATLAAELPAGVIARLRRPRPWRSPL